LIRNACTVAGNLADNYAASTPEWSQLCRRLSELAASADPLVAEHAAWALARFTGRE